MKKLLFIGAFIAAAFLFFTSCEKFKDVYIVTFDAQGGSSVSAVAVEPNAKLVEPKKPVKDGFDFAGWYKEPSLVNAWDFDKDVVEKDIILYAKWSSDVAVIRFDNWGDYQGKGTQNFFLVLESNAVQYVFDLYSPTAEAVGGKVSIAAGTYEFDGGDPPTFEQFTFAGTESRIYMPKSSISINEGVLVVSKNGNNYVLTANLVAEDGLRHTFVYNGELASEPYDPYSSEPVQTTTPLNLVGSGNYAQLSGIANAYNINIVEDGAFEAHLILFCSNASLDGTYPINSSNAVGSALASRGYDAGGVWPSFAIVKESGDASNFFYLLEGTVTVSGSNLTVAATSAHGSAVNISCNDLSPQLNENAPAKKSSIKKDYKFKNRY